MNSEAIVLSILGLGVLALVLKMRQTRQRKERELRMMRSLEMCIQREIGWREAPPADWYIRRAS